MRILAIALACGLLIGAPAWADMVANCDQGADPDLRLSACTSLIDGGGATGADLARALVNRGQVHTLYWDIAAAMGDFDAALEIEPDNTDALFHRAQAFLNAGYNSEAIADYDRFLAIFPDHPRAYVLRGIAHQGLGQHAAALADFAQAIGIEPDNADTHFRRGQTHHVLADYRAAIAAFDQSLSLDADYGLSRTARAFSQNALAWELYLSGQPVEALSLIDDAISVVDNDEGVFADTRAHVLAALGRLDEAADAFVRAAIMGGSSRSRRYRDALAEHGFDAGDLPSFADPAARDVLMACLQAGCRLLE